MSSARTRRHFFEAGLGDTSEFLPVSESEDFEENGGCIRPARYSDLDQIVDMERVCFPGPMAYSRSQLEYLAFAAHGECLVDSVGDEIRGVVILLFRNGSKVAGIETIGVNPKHRGKGVGAKLLTAAENEMRAHGITKSQLEVAKGNLNAAEMYSKAGYKVVKVLPKYYQHDFYGSRDALRMRKDLKD
jgi:ribosomal protein S18 acetylase RimI-like enzyme